MMPAPCRPSACAPSKGPPGQTSCSGRWLESFQISTPALARSRSAVSCPLSCNALPSRRRSRAAAGAHGPTATGFGSSPPRCRWPCRESAAARCCSSMRTGRRGSCKTPATGSSVAMGLGDAASFERLFHGLASASASTYSLIRHSPTGATG